MKYYDFRHLERVEMGDVSLIKNIVIALDAMGGDDAPDIVVNGAELAFKRNKNLSFRFYGDEKQINKLLDDCPAIKPVSTVIHSDMAISNDEKPSVALRTGKNSSMRMAIDAVANGEASCVVSAGNTGALMAMAKIGMRLVPGIDRPAIATVMPSMKGLFVMLDLGANTVCTAQHLVEFALMGVLYSKTVLGIKKPSYGLLNIGTEETKGLDVIKEAAQILKENKLPGEYVGFVEGDGIHRGDADVIVCDGFIGNISLKTAEGTAKLIVSWVKQAFSSSLLAKIGYVFMRPALSRLKNLADPRRYNGAMFLGLKGICVKSHGGTDAFGFSNAIDVAAQLVKRDYNAKIQQEVEAHRDLLQQKVAS
jgi:glycerol-3-phosphate acyltransferase PlsX